MEQLPRSRLDERIFPDASRPLSKLSIAETFCLLACSTLSKLRVVPVATGFICDRSNPEERDVAVGRLAVLSIATIAEVPEPGRCDEADVCGVTVRKLLSRKGEACRLCIPPSSSFIICKRMNS